MTEIKKWADELAKALEKIANGDYDNAHDNMQSAKIAREALTTYRESVKES